MLNTCVLYGPGILSAILNASAERCGVTFQRFMAGIPPGPQISEYHGQMRDPMPRKRSSGSSLVMPSLLPPGDAPAQTGSLRKAFSEGDGGIRNACSGSSR